MGMHRGAVSATAAVILCVVSTTAQAQESCWQPHEVQAARVRDLQTLLMVGALKCNAPSYNTAGHYNNFVAQNRAILGGYNGVLKVRFMREHGVSEGQRAYDNFTTALANRHSSDADASAATFCQMVDSVVRMAANSTAAADIEALATGLTERPLGVGDDCPVSTPATAVVQPAEPNTAVLVSSPPPAAIDAQSAGQQVSPAASPVVGVAAQPDIAAPAAAPSQQSAAEALQAAAVAIQSAAAALQSAQSADAANTAAQPAAAPQAADPAEPVTAVPTEPVTAVPVPGATASPSGQ